MRGVTQDRFIALAAELRKKLLPVMPGKKLTVATDGIINWPTLQNRRSRGEVPAEIFFYSGRTVLVDTNLLLDWWLTTLSNECPAPVPPHRAVREDQEAAPVGPARRQGRRRVQRAPVEMEAASD
jgi:hypothetical protein